MASCRRDQFADGCNRRGVADQTERFRCPATNHQRRIRSNRVDERGHRRPVSKQPEPEGSHLPHIVIGILDQALERGSAFGQPDSPQGDSRTAAHARVGVGGQHEQIGNRRRRRDDGNRASTLRRRRWRYDRRGRIRIAQHAQVLEPEDGCQLLGRGDRGSGRRWGRCGGAGACAQREAQGQQPPGRPGFRGSNRRVQLCGAHVHVSRLQFGEAPMASATAAARSRARRAPSRSPHRYLVSSAPEWCRRSLPRWAAR